MARIRLRYGFLRLDTTSIQLGYETVEQLADPRTQLLKRYHQHRLPSSAATATLHHLGHAHHRPRLHPLGLLPHCLEQQLHEQSHHRPYTSPATPSAVSLQILRGEGAHGVTAGEVSPLGASLCEVSE